MRFAVVTLIAALAALSSAMPARAAESLDPSFGEGGISLPGIYEGDIAGLAQDSRDGLIGAGGNVFGNLVARFQDGGTLDREFGNEGGWTSSELGFDARANAVVIQPDGKILTAGTTSSGSFVLVRYQEGGHQFDPSFGGRLHGTSKGIGRTVTVAGSIGGGAQALDLQRNGRILVAGYGIDNHHHWKAMVAAYRSNGTLDRRFGHGGIFTLRPGAGGQVPIELVAVKDLPGGRTIAAGDVGGRLMVASIRPNGSLDPHFGDNGLAVTDVDPTHRCICTYATDMEIDHQGRIVLSANVTRPRRRQPVALVRYLPNGKLDRSFGRGGIARAARGSRLAGKAIAIQPNGRIVLAGTYNVPATGEARVAAARFLPSGNLDRTFARRGLFTHDFGGESVAYAALAQRDGRVVIGGRAITSEPSVPEDEFPPSVFDGAQVFLIRFLP